MAIIFKAPEEETWSDIADKPKLFLAGSIEMGKAENWQTKLTEELKDLDVVIFNPRRDDFDPKAEQSSDNPYLREQIEWERFHLDVSNIVVFYFAPDTISPISLFEIGVMTAEHKAGKKQLIVYCPDGYQRKANVDINCEWDNIPMFETWESFVEETKNAIKNF